MRSRGAATDSAAVLLSLLVAAASPLAALPQPGIHFDRLTTADGLSQGTINAIAQDATGFMWFGTQDGLNRFDGYDFRIFEEDADDPASLARSWIWALEVDGDGVLWVGTDGGGLSRWDPGIDGFRTLRHDPTEPRSLSSDVVRAILEDREGRLWVGTDRGLNLLEPGEASFERFTHDPADPSSLAHDEVRALLEDARGRLWIGTGGGGLDRFDRETGRFVHHRHDPELPGSIGSDRIGALLEDREGRLWIGTLDRGLWRLDPERGRFEALAAGTGEPLEPGRERVRSLLEDRQGRLWIGTDDGLEEWHPDRRDLRRHVHSPHNPASLVDDSVGSIFQDRGGVLWIGSGRGLSRWNPVLGSFGTYTAASREELRLTGDSVTAFAEAADGGLWVGTYEGLNRIHPETGEITRIRSRDGLADDRVMALLVDGDDRLWIGTYDRGLQRYDARRGTFAAFRHDPGDPRSLAHDSVAELFRDAAGALWVGTYGGGLHRFDPRTGGFVRFRHASADPRSLASDRVMALTEDSLGTLWVGTDGDGLSGLDRGTGTFTNIRAGGDEGLPSDMIWSLHEDGRGDLWIGTGRQGIARWRLEDRRDGRARFDCYTVEQGLPNNVVYGILEDDEGLLWIATNRGLSRLDPQAGTFRNFDIASGLASNEFNFGAYLRTRAGEMYFGTNHGFNFFHPADIQRNRHKPPVVLTSVRKNNVPLEPGRTGHPGEEVLLGHDDHVLSFEFTALDYSAPAKIQYAYKLEGFDSAWMHTREHRLATYTNLRPGNYTFRVRASNGDGLWNEEGLAVPVRVVRPPWRSWWAYTLYALAAAALFVSYAWSQHRRLEQEAQHARELELEVARRTSELAERNNELEEANDKLQQASFTDSLTGLRNRRYLMYTIEADIALVDRYYRDLPAEAAMPTARRPDFLFLIFDLDGFKEVNDTYGHAAGDRVLIQVKEILEGACRRSDTVIRWGGDEFLIVGRYADRTAAEILSDRIRLAVAEQSFSLGNGVETRLSCSIGFAHYPFSTAAPTWLSWGQVLAIADRALYIAKNSGRNAWVGLHDTPSTLDLSAEDLVHRVNEEVEQLVSDGYLELHSSIADEQELVWGWG